MSTESKSYSRPTVKDLGTISSVTLADIPKKGVRGDTITVNGGTPIAVPGSSLA